MYALNTDKLTKVYSNGVSALKDVDLKIKKGDFFALLGANGAGKTTLIGILTGIVNKTLGKVKIFDIDIDENHNQAKTLIGVVPQEFNFSIFEKVLDIVTQQAGYFGLPRKKSLNNAERILNQLGLWNKRNHTAMSLSGGMKRRLMIARALIHDPEFLILDEPTAGVDVELRHEMWDYLTQINRQGKTILLTTHYLEEAEQLCKNVAIIKEGKIIRQDSMLNTIKSLDTQTYIITVNKVGNGKFGDYDINIVDGNTMEVDLGMNRNINELVSDLSSQGISILDLRPKGNRLEQLFLNIHKK